MSERLAYLAQRAGQDPFFLASALALYARSEQLDDPGLARELGCPPATLTLLRLCRRPRPEPAAFREDVGRIGARFAVDADVLARIVRRADALEGLRAASSATTVRDDAGLLLAARDRDDEEPPEGEPGGRP
jgi:hypothetical protein